MSTAERKLTGKSGRIYQLKAEIGSGGEGTVYQTEDPATAVKVYKKPQPDLERKILYMVSCPIDSYAKDAARTPVIAWPQDALYENGQFAGYAMPLAMDTIPIYTLCRSGEKARSFFQGYSWLTHLGVAFNLANTVKYLHSMGCVVGDMNSKNIVVHRNGFITFLDVDSFDLTDPATGEHFPCTVGRPEFLPPELQGRDLRNSRFTIHSDEFSLAVHIFRLLLHNRHPFDVKVTRSGGESVNESRQEYNISVGNCAYVRPVPGCEVPPNEPTLDMLPQTLQDDFCRTFDYTDSSALTKASLRTSAAQWTSDLGSLYKNRDSVLEQCEQDPEHYFLKERGFCEFCRVMPSRQAHAPTKAPMTWKLEFLGCNAYENETTNNRKEVAGSKPWFFHTAVREVPENQATTVYCQIFYPDGTQAARRPLVQQAKTGDMLTVKCGLALDGAALDIGGLCKAVLSDINGNTLAEMSVNVLPAQKPRPSKKPIFSKRSKPPKAPGNPQQPPRKRPGKRTVILACLWLLSVLAVGGVMQAQNDTLQSENRRLLRETYTLESTVSSLKDTNAELEQEISELEALEQKIDELEAEKENLADKNQELKETSALYEKKAAFLDNYIRVVTDGQTTYHRYGCPKWDSGKDFYAYNINLAKYKGYTPCPVCCGND